MIITLHPVGGDLRKRTKEVMTNARKAHYHCKHLRDDPKSWSDNSNDPQGLPAKSSLAIAEFTGKRHERVLKDAPKIFEDMGLIGVVNSDAYSLAEPSINGQNKAQPWSFSSRSQPLRPSLGYSVKLLL